MAPTPPGLTLRIERRLPVPRERVFAALTEQEQLRRWWGPRGFSVPGLEFDLHTGGRYRIAMEPPEGEVFHVAGAFLELAPPSRLAYTFRWEEPDPDDRETVVDISLDQRDEATLLTVTQGSFATRARLELHRQGWSESLDRLSEVLAATG
jgi:uncharacterized protein YndB with AHSA1/START domain